MTSTSAEDEVGVEAVEGTATLGVESVEIDDVAVEEMDEMDDETRPGCMFGITVAVGVAVG